MPEADPAPPPDAARSRWATLAVVALVVLPVLVLVVALAQRTWHPTGDQAQAELRMRSLPRHIPLVGQPGRIVDEQGRQGSHPGPLMYWATWPLYALLGRSSWAFEAATAAVNAAWLAVTVWLVRRRTSAALAWWWGAVALVLIGGYGLNGMSQPWNPWVALLPFSALLLTTWSALEGDRWLLPLGVFAGSYALQGHAGYAVLVPLLLAVSVVALALPPRRSRSAPDPDDVSTGGSAEVRPLRSWSNLLVPLGVAVVVGLAAWSGPIIDALRNDPSNLDKLVANFSHPSSDPIGLGRAVELLLQALAPTGPWLFGGDLVSGSVVPGLLVLAAWAAVAVLAWRAGERALTHLNLVLGVSLLGAVYAMSRIFGDVYLYVFRWVCALMAGLVFATGWGVVVLARRRRPIGRITPRAVAVAFTALALLAGLTSFRLARAELPYRFSGRLEQELAPEVARHLDRRTTYQVRWDDPAFLGGLGFGLILDLERRGFHVGAPPQFDTAVEPRRVLCPGQFGAVLLVATGDTTIARWRAQPGYRLIARADIRTPAQKREYDRTFRELRRLLAARGRALSPAELTAQINLLVLNSSEPRAINRRAARLVTLGVPSAVFLADPAPAEPPLPRTALNEPCATS